MASTWYEQLKDPRWQRKRLEVMQRDEFRCRVCFDDKETLNVHHGYYEKGKAPWEYNDDTLWTLCEQCHNETVGCLMHDIHLEIGRIDPHFLNEFFGFMIEFNRYLHEVIMNGNSIVFSPNRGCRIPKVFVTEKQEA